MPTALEIMQLAVVVYTLIILPMAGFLIRLWAKVQQLERDSMSQASLREDLKQLWPDVQQLKRDSIREASLHEDLKHITERLIRVEVLLDRRLPKE